jgi:hypothetical protein
MMPMLPRSCSSRAGGYELKSVWWMYCRATEREAKQCQTHRDLGGLDVGRSTTYDGDLRDDVVRDSLSQRLPRMSVPTLTRLTRTNL